MDLDKVRTDNKYLKEKHCLVAHVDLIQACHNGDWEKVVTQADILISKKALDRDSMYCLAKALKNLGRGHEALNTYLKAGSAETSCKLEYWGTCSSGLKDLESEFGAAILCELGFPLSPEVWKASDHYELASYLVAAGKYGESKIANQRGDKIINSYCPPDKAICQRLKVFMKDRIH